MNSFSLLLNENTECIVFHAISSIAPGVVRPTTFVWCPLSVGNTKYMRYAEYKSGIPYMQGSLLPWACIPLGARILQY